ncbi:MAG: Flp pilus assembly protein CpaB, partial [Alphaproteobacteria bacterium]
ARAYFTEQTAEASLEPVLTGPKIIVAERNLEVGAFLTAQDVRWQATAADEPIVLSQHFVEGAVQLEGLLGAVVRRPIGLDQPLTAANVIKPGQRGFLAAVLRPGMRAVTVEIDKVSGNSGLVFPGDHVDLILTVEIKDKDESLSRRLASETILSDVRVIAMGQRVESFATIDAEPDSRPATTATLEVAPQYAERIQVAQELGRIALSLRSLADDTLDSERVIGGKPPEQDLDTL